MIRIKDKSGKTLVEIPYNYLIKGNLSGLDLADADLKWSYMTDINLSGANLTGAELSFTDLKGANLTGANLTGANLTGAILFKANLSQANLTGADLTGAIFDLSNLSGTEGIFYANFDKRDYTLVIWRKGEAFQVLAGCRSFGLREALEHWGSPSYPVHERGQMYVSMIRELID